MGGRIGHLPARPVPTSCHRRPWPAGTAGLMEHTDGQCVGVGRLLPGSSAKFQLVGWHFPMVCVPRVAALPQRSWTEPEHGCRGHPACYSFELGDGTLYISYMICTDRACIMLMRMISNTLITLI